MALDTDEIGRVAHLAHLRLEPAESEQLRAQLARILEYMAVIDAADAASVEGTTHAVGLSCPLRDDRVAPSMDPGDAVRGAPLTEGAQFRVPRFVG